MSMIKLIMPGSQDFGEASAQMIKMSSRGLVGHDRSVFIKRAGAEFAHQLVGIKTAKDEPLIHMLAVGATEDYGANRNGDGFRREVCDRYHDTFVKHARFYRDHRNKDKAKSYGLIKLSAYHRPMQRIELVVALNGSEAAAKRNGGLFADREMEKLSSDRDIAVSMACRVPFDVCSYCENKAPSRAQYCTDVGDGGMCKAGGLKRNMGSIVDIDGGIHHLHADNPDPTFFDISHVFRPADRIAYVSGLLKSAGHCKVSGAELAEAAGVTIPYELLIDSNCPSNVRGMLKVAYQLVDLEEGLEVNRTPADRFAGAFLREVQEESLDPPPFVREKIGYAFKALAEQQIALPLSAFVELMTEQTTKEAAATAEIVSDSLPGVYGRLARDPDFADRIAHNPYTPSPVSSQVFRDWATKRAAVWSLSPYHVERRVHLAAMRRSEDASVNRGVVEDNEKQASENGPVNRLAEEYALYKLAFLCSVSNEAKELPLTASLTILQNYAK